MISTRTLELRSGDATLSCLVVGEGPLVVCAHGFPDCERTFREQVPVLVRAGYTLAVPSMRGYAPSTPSAEGRYDPRTLGRDLLNIAAALRPHERVFLIGHDWGAVATYAAAAMGADRVRGIVTLAVPHLRVAAPRFLRPAQLRRSAYMGLFQPRKSGVARLLKDDLALIDELWRAWSPGYACPKAELEKIKAAVRPHPDAVLGYYRALRSPRVLASRAGHILFEPVRVPALYLHGADDGCVGAELARALEPAYRAAFECAILDDCGHFLHIERPDEVNRRLCAFFASCP
ncbi:MAG: alpha/beta hydrolase [Myxococcales bacterium]|nr:alpha/beta hydrolase [Myxococcales bacterium]